LVDTFFFAKELVPLSLLSYIISFISFLDIFYQKYHFLAIGYYNPAAPYINTVTQINKPQKILVYCIWNVGLISIPVDAQRPRKKK
jgi:hypothetical protein